MFVVNWVRAKQLFILLFLGSICLLFLGLMKSSQASTVDVFGPKVYAKYSIGAPGEDFKVGLNITHSEKAVNNVILYYAVVSLDEERPTDISEFSNVSMILEEGDVHRGFWTYQFPGQANSTQVYFFASVLDSNGEEMSPLAHPEYASLYRIFTKNPCFQILFLSIDAINIKTLTADISFSVYIVAPYDSEYLSLMVDDNGNQTEVRVSQIGNRYEYSGQFKLNGLNLIGNPTAVPFDEYHLDLDFFIFIECKPEALFKAVSISNYNDLATWQNSWIITEEEGPPFSTIHVSNVIQRRIESTYFFVIPTAVCFFLLGGSHLLPNKKHLGHRLTIYLTIFVFLLGSFSVNQIVRDMVPNIAYGITGAELTLAWLAGYLGIYLFFSLLGYFVGDSKIRGMKLALILDLCAFITVISIFFVFPVVRIESPYQSEIYTLYTLVTNTLFRMAIIFGMGYGVALEILKIPYLKVKQRKLLSKGMDY